MRMKLSTILILAVVPAAGRGAGGHYPVDSATIAAFRIEPQAKWLLTEIEPGRVTRLVFNRRTGGHILNPDPTVG